MTQCICSARISPSCPSSGPSSGLTARSTSATGRAAQTFGTLPSRSARSTPRGVRQLRHCIFAASRALQPYTATRMSWDVIYFVHMLVGRLLVLAICTYAVVCGLWSVCGLSVLPTVPCHYALHLPSALLLAPPRARPSAARTLFPSSPLPLFPSSPCPLPHSPFPFPIFPSSPLPVMADLAPPAGV